jgi:hypothetical protein
MTRFDDDDHPRVPPIRTRWPPDWSKYTDPGLIEDHIRRNVTAEIQEDCYDLAYVILNSMVNDMVSAGMLKVGVGNALRQGFHDYFKRLGWKD